MDSLQLCMPNPEDGFLVLVRKFDASCLGSSSVCTLTSLPCPVSCFETSSWHRTQTLFIALAPAVFALVSVSACSYSLYRYPPSGPKVSTCLPILFHIFSSSLLRERVRLRIYCFLFQQPIAIHLCLRDGRTRNPVTDVPNARSVELKYALITLPSPEYTSSWSLHLKPAHPTISTSGKRTSTSLLIFVI